VGKLVSRFARASQYGCGMTGSGSACYCMAGHRQHAMSMARRLRQGGVQEVFVVRTAV
jgi:4-diphosphocytidyl-2C-methyl-D-erythritol kinase